jgi:hypothetical protein
MRIICIYCKHFIMKRILILLLLLIFTSFALSFQLTKQRESYYQKKFAGIMNGKMEVVLDDLARVDIVTDTFAIEVDFADKWSQSVGQSLYYADKLNKKAGILLVVNGHLDDRYVKRLMAVAYKHGITVWIMDYNNDSWGIVDVDVRYVY